MQFFVFCFSKLKFGDDVQCNTDGEVLTRTAVVTPEKCPFTKYLQIFCPAKHVAHHTTHIHIFAKDVKEIFRNNKVMMDDPLVPSRASHSIRGSILSKASLV